MQNSATSIFCIFRIYMHPPLCWCWYPDIGVNIRYQYRVSRYQGMIATDIVVNIGHDIGYESHSVFRGHSLHYIPDRWLDSHQRLFEAVICISLSFENALTSAWAGALKGLPHCTHTVVHTILSLPPRRHPWPVHDKMHYSIQVGPCHLQSKGKSYWSTAHY